MHEFGKLVLNKNPENYHRDIEQLEFSPGSMVPGVEASPDTEYAPPIPHSLLSRCAVSQTWCEYASNSRQLSFHGYDMKAILDSTLTVLSARTQIREINPHYVPNSFVNKFRSDCAEHPIAVSK